MKILPKIPSTSCLSTNYCFLLLCSLLSFPSFCQQNNSTIVSNNTSAEWLTNFSKARFDLPASINPDFAQSELGKYGGKWNNKLGTGIGLLKGNGANLRTSLTMEYWNGNGRGLDFPRVFQDWGLGMKVIL